jgi:S-adenosylmethionine:tRNA ribosyltransferase-isomerase
VTSTAYSLSDFDYLLPEALIAQHPPAERGGSRLLDATHGLRDRMFAELPALLQAGDLLVFNDTKVIPARLFAQKDTGGKVEILIERIVDARTALAQVRASKSPKAGARLQLSEGVEIEVMDRREPFFLLRFPDGQSVVECCEHYGQMPLPPYITHTPNAEDDARYQTVFARNPGAVAAPTAGLHFTETMLAQLTAHGVQRAAVTLHVGAGTFQPVRVENLSQHVMHSEWYAISVDVAQQINAAKREGRRVVAVGTTAMRAMESAATGPGAVAAGARDTQLFITPGYTFNIVDVLITNFHLPKSTLLMLVSAFAGYATIRDAYAHAVQSEYRFFSYGDAMLLQRASASA